MAYFKLVPDLDWRMQTPFNHYVNSRTQNLDYEIHRLELAYDVDHVICTQISQEEYCQNVKIPLDSKS